jgi:hypothetical protein
MSRGRRALPPPSRWLTLRTVPLGNGCQRFAHQRPTSKTDHNRQYVLRITEHRTDYPVRELPASNGDVSTAADSTQISCNKAWRRVTLPLAVDRCRCNCSHLEGWKGGLADASVRRNAFIRFVDSSYRESGSCTGHGSARADGYPQLQPAGTQRQSPRILLLRLATRTA